MKSQHDLQVYVSVDPPFSGLIPGLITEEYPEKSQGSECLEQGWLERVSHAALRAAGDFSAPAQMSLLITDDATIQSLNGQFRGTDEVTDVLSFSAEHAGHWEGEDEGPDAAIDLQFVLPPDEPAPLGEVIVSYPQTQRQAEDHGVALEHELAHLVVHGVLHLTGHDHLEPVETALMQAKERSALQDLGISLKLPSDPDPDPYSNVNGDTVEISEVNQA